MQIYKQLKARIKINVIEEKRSLLGGKKKQYTTKIVTIDELVKLSVEEKEEKGLVVQELKVNKLAMSAL